MDSSDENRKRLRQKIRNMRNNRVGTSNEPPENPEINSLLRVQDPAKREELSRRVEAELHKVFGSDPDAMKVAEPFIKDPMSVFKSSTDMLSKLSTEEREAIQSLMMTTTEENEEEAPPM